MRKIFVFLLFIFVFPSSVSAQEITFEIKPVISNLTTNSFTVSWYSRDREEQVITYGKADTTSFSAVDDKGPGFQGVTHHIKLTNLEPNTEYQFKVRNNSQVFRQKTLALIPNVLPPLPERFKGKITNEENSIPQESIVYLKIPGVQLLSARSNEIGDWQIRTENTRLEDLTKYYKLRETDYVDFYVRAGFEGDNAKKIFAYARENPIDIRLMEPKLPFYKIKLPGQEIYEAELSSINEVSNPETPPVNTNLQPASDQGFFSTIWKRVRDLF